MYESRIEVKMAVPVVDMGLGKERPFSPPPVLESREKFEVEPTKITLRVDPGCLRTRLAAKRGSLISGMVE